MHKEGIKVTVDVAAWNSIWDFKLIGQTDVDRVMYVKRMLPLQLQLNSI